MSSEDLAMVRPGETGWLGSEGDRRLFDEGADQNPELFTRRPAKEADPVALAACRAIMAEDGVEDGIWFRAIEKYVFGDYLDWLRQIIGSCVGSSFMRGACKRTMWESFVLGDPEQIWGTKLIGTNNVAPFAPYGYRAGRKIAGINGGDGSFCSAQIRGAQQYGILPCSAPGIVSDAFPEPQSSRTYREMGNSNAFLDRFADAAGKHKLLETEKVLDIDTAKELICEHMKPLQICSMWAFRPSRDHPDWRLADGQPVSIYQRDRSTSWAHAMMIDGFIKHAGSWYVVVQNSWGMRAHRNGDFFIIPAAEFESWLRDAECMSIGDIELTDNVLLGS